MEAFYRHAQLPSGTTANEAALLSSVEVLLKQRPREAHELAIETLLSNVEGAVSFCKPSSADRDVVLAQMRLELCDVIENSQSRWKNLVYPHLDFIDSTYDAFPLKDDALREIGGDALLELLKDYGAVRNLHAEPPLLEQPPTDRMRRKIKAQENDTAGTIAARYNCTAKEIEELNPNLVAEGFGSPRGGKLRRGTAVVVLT